MHFLLFVSCLIGFMTNDVSGDCYRPNFTDPYAIILQPDQSTYTRYYFIDFTCEEGHTKSGLPDRTYCGSSDSQPKEWDPDPSGGRCEAQCNTNELLDDDILVTNSSEDGTALTLFDSGSLGYFSCRGPGQFTGVESSICVNGTFNYDTAPTCLSHCPIYDQDLKNGLSYDDEADDPVFNNDTVAYYVNGGSVKFKCDDGYEELNCTQYSLSDCKSTCNDGTWSVQPNVPTCVESDECDSNPCQNNATCDDMINEYTCRCAAGFNGTNCENNIDDCVSNDCKNGATCVDGVDSYECECLDGYNGTFCENDIDECWSDPCQNGATCTDLVNDFNCTCVPGYLGDICDEDIDECGSDPCQNNATCNNLINEYTCQCLNGFNGTNCENNIDECWSDPCQNGATCTDLVNGFNCTCAPGYLGDICDEVITTAPMTTTMITTDITGSLGTTTDPVLTTDDQDMTTMELTTAMSMSTTATSDKTTISTMTPTTGGPDSTTLLDSSTAPPGTTTGSSDSTTSIGSSTASPKVTTGAVPTTLGSDLTTVIDSSPAPSGTTTLAAPTTGSPDLTTSIGSSTEPTKVTTGAAPTTGSPDLTTAIDSSTAPPRTTTGAAPTTGSPASTTSIGSSTASPKVTTGAVPTTLGSDLTTVIDSSPALSGTTTLAAPTTGSADLTTSIGSSTEPTRVTTETAETASDSTMSPQQTTVTELDRSTSVTTNPTEKPITKRPTTPEKTEEPQTTPVPCGGCLSTQVCNRETNECDCRPEYYYDEEDPDNPCKEPISIDVTIRITAQENDTEAEYKEEYADPDSDEFKKLEKDVCEPFNEIYSDDPDYEDCRVLSFTNGSIIVNYALRFAENSTESASSVNETLYEEVGNPNSSFSDFEIDKKSIVVEPLNECEQLPLIHTCDVNATCIDKGASGYTCKCNDGFEDDGQLPGRKCKLPIEHTTKPITKELTEPSTTERPELGPEVWKVVVGVTVPIMSILIITIISLMCWQYRRLDKTSPTSTSSPMKMNTNPYEESTESDHGPRPESMRIINNNGTVQEVVLPWRNNRAESDFVFAPESNNNKGRQQMLPMVDYPHDYGSSSYEDDHGNIVNSFDNYTYHNHETGNTTEIDSRIGYF